MTIVGTTKSAVRRSRRLAAASTLSAPALPAKALSSKQMETAESLPAQHAQGALPETFFLTYAEMEPIVLHGRSLYQISPQAKSKDKFVFAGENLALVKTAGIDDLEKLYKELNSSQVGVYLDSYIQSRLRQKRATYEEVKKRLASNTVLNFIVTELLPYFQKDSEQDISAVIKDEKDGEKAELAAEHDFYERILKEVDTSDVELTARQKKEIAAEVAAEEKTLNSIIDEFYEKCNARPRKATSASGSLISRLVLEDGIATVRDTVYRLVRKSGEGPCIIIEGESFSLEPLEAISEFEARYDAMLSQQLKIDALRESEEYQKVIVKLEKESKAFEKFASAREYQFGDFGFFRMDNNNYMVWQQVPEFALKETNADIYCLFPECKVAVTISADRNIYADPNYSGSINCSTPFVFTNNGYPHPFVIEYTTNPQVCLGTFKHDSVSRLPPAQKVMKYLSVAKNVLTKGYKKGAKPYSSRVLISMQSMWVPRDVIEKRKVRVTNVNERGEVP